MADAQLQLASGAVEGAEVVAMLRSSASALQTQSTMDLMQASPLKASLADMEDTMGLLGSALLSLVNGGAGGPEDSPRDEYLGDPRLAAPSRHGQISVVLPEDIPPSEPPLKMLTNSYTPASSTPPRRARVRSLSSTDMAFSLRNPTPRTSPRTDSNEKDSDVNEMDPSLYASTPRSPAQQISLIATARRNSQTRAGGGRATPTLAPVLDNGDDRDEEDREKISQLQSQLLQSRDEIETLKKQVSEHSSGSVSPTPPPPPSMIGLGLKLEPEPEPELKSGRRPPPLPRQRSADAGWSPRGNSRSPRPNTPQQAADDSYEKPVSVRISRRGSTLGLDNTKVQSLKNLPAKDARYVHICLLCRLPADCRMKRMLRDSPANYPIGGAATT